MRVYITGILLFCHRFGQQEAERIKARIANSIIHADLVAKIIGGELVEIANKGDRAQLCGVLNKSESEVFEIVEVEATLSLC